MAYVISGNLSNEGRVIIFKESDWSVESNTVISGGGAYEVEVADGDYRMVACRSNEGELLGYGKVTPGYIPAFEFTVEPASPFELPLTVSGTYNFTVDWGDESGLGTITEWDDVAKNHNYAGSGPYTVTIEGTIVGWSFNNNSYASAMRDISSWGPLRLGNDGAYFKGCTNLTISDTNALDTTGTTNMFEAFMGCNSLTTGSNINNWDMSLVTNMAAMFAFPGGKSPQMPFNMDISEWDTGSATTMQDMFRQCTDFNQDISGWNTSSVENFYL